jgi:hypothetical protein
VQEATTETSSARPGELSLECKSCGAALALATTQRTATCPFCASPNVVDRPRSIDRPAPRFAIGFTVTRERAQAAVREWARTGLFRHSGLDAANIAEMAGAYVPAFLYSAASEASFTANIGEDYQETETYTVMVDGKPQKRTRTVTKTEWRALGGQWAGYVHDVLVTASRGVSNVELEALEPYDLGSMRRYTPALISGWIAEDPSMEHSQCLALARKEAEAVVGQRLRAFMPGDHHSALAYEWRSTGESLDLVLVPVWIVAVRHRPDAPPLRVLVNGLSGKLVSGRKPLSWWKVTLAIALAVIAIGGPIALAYLRQRGYL